jgi:hypothetical protein
MGSANVSAIAIIFLAIPLASFVSFLVAPLVAWRKGFSPYYWLFACGPIGLVVVCGLKSLKKANTPEEYERNEARVNLAGSILTGIALFLSVVGLIPLTMLGLIPRFWLVLGLG